MKRLSEKCKTLIGQAVRTFGTYDPDEVLPYIEEELTGAEYNTVNKFLSYLHTNNLCYGWGNFDEVWIGYLEDKNVLET